MQASRFVYPLKLKQLCNSARIAYLKQYQNSTPEEVLLAYTRTEYNLCEWLICKHHNRTTFWFLYSGNQIAGFMRLKFHPNATEIIKIFIFRKYRKHKGAAILLQKTGTGEVFLKVYAGNDTALKAFCRLGFKIKAKFHFQAKCFNQSGLILNQQFSSFNSACRFLILKENN